MHFLSFRGVCHTTASDLFPFLFMDKTSSMYLYVKLNRDFNCLPPVESKDCINATSLEKRNRLAKRGAQMVPIGIPTICWKTFPAKNAENAVYRKLKHLDDVIFKVLVLVLVFGVKVFLHKICFSRVS